MRYGIIKQLILYKKRNDRILIENIFKETTRSGQRILGRVHLALTPTAFIIGSENALKGLASHAYWAYKTELRELISFHPLESVHLSIFKKSKRQSIKICFEEKMTRYFELESNCNRKTFWKIWNIYVFELNNDQRMWPFTARHGATDKLSVSVETPMKEYILRWTDKYLYLGQQREIEDKNRPLPIPGLGSTEFIKLINLKSQYFGCWSQSDHWVQCE